MRQTRTRLAHRAALGAASAALAVSLLVVSGASAAAEEAKAGDTCAQRYGASLKRIAEGEYQAVKAARPAQPAEPATADPALPGLLLFTPTSVGARTPAETAAVRTAVSLARSRGRSLGNLDEDARWMGDRLRLSLSDYLMQGPSPYLCGGVADYVATLRGFAARLGPTPAQRDGLVATQRQVAARALVAALDAMKPVPRPASPPADRPVPGPASDLRPTAGLDRVDTSIATGSTSAAPAAAAVAAPDPDLAPLTPKAPPALDSAPDLVAAVDRLTKAAAENGYLAATPNALPAGGTPAVSAPAYPVLARLAEARPLVAGARPLVADRAARQRLAAALSAIETLDYLMRARVGGGDPLAVAIEGTFEAILKAHATDCTCGE